MGLKRSQNEIPECRHAKNKAPNDFLKVMLHGTIHNDGFLQKKKTKTNCNLDAALRYKSPLQIFPRNITFKVTLQIFYKGPEINMSHQLTIYLFVTVFYSLKLRR